MIYVNHFNAIIIINISENSDCRGLVATPFDVENFSLLPQSPVGDLQPWGEAGL